MKKSHLLSSILLALPVAAFSANHQAAVKLLNQLTHNQVSIVKQFDATPNLQGFVITPKAGGSENILYVDNQGQYLFSGTLVNANGQNISQHYHDLYVNAKLAQNAYQAGLSKLHWFVDGSNNAPHKAYVFFDPNCVYCHLLYKALRPMIDNSQVQIRWITIAIRPHSTGKAAKILSGVSDKARLTYMAEDAVHFNMQTEQGSLEPLQANANDKAITAAFSAVSTNTNFFINQHFIGTPVMLYKKANGQAVLIPGFLRGDSLKKTIDQMGKQW